MGALREYVLSKQPEPVLEAIKKLEERGLIFMCHFGPSNAVSSLAEMNAAYEQGRLYEWMKERGFSQQ